MVETGFPEGRRSIFGCRQSDKQCPLPHLPKTTGFPGWIDTLVKRNSAPRPVSTLFDKVVFPIETPPASSSTSACRPCNINSWSWTGSSGATGAKPVSLPPLTPGRRWNSCSNYGFGLFQAPRRLARSQSPVARMATRGLVNTFKEDLPVEAATAIAAWSIKAPGESSCSP